ncbi:MAG: L-rhamnose mutarotase [Thermoflavifilum sp.]|nr:L-rhamnose mutarotase [Thermoflavifilum sp.]
MGNHNNFSTQRYCLFLDLKDNPEWIAQYEAYHQQVWPAILQSIQDAGIEQMEIYRAGNRLCMILETTPSFSFSRKQQMDEANPIVKQWEQLMDHFQQRLPFARATEKWVLGKKIFDLQQQLGV